MKRFSIFVAIALVGAAVGLSQINCAAPAGDNANAPAANNNVATNANASSSPANNAAIESALTQMERDWTKAFLSGDADAIKRIEADDIIFVDPSGTGGGKADDVRDAGNKAFSADSWEIVDIKPHVVSNDTAVVMTRTVIKNGKYKKEGKDMDISGEYRGVDTFVNRDGRWQVVASGGAKIAKP
jgi:ketosteroid isomerase-like protein